MGRSADWPSSQERFQRMPGIVREGVDPGYRLCSQPESR